MSSTTSLLGGLLSELFDDGLADFLIDLRRDLHRHPELSFEEHRTAERLERALDELGIEAVERVGETGVVARITGSAGDSSGEAPKVAVRGDIDALPIQEETGLEFSSLNPGVMHACGHDVHATWTVGAAALLSRAPAQSEVVIVLLSLPRSWAPERRKFSPVAVSRECRRSSGDTSIGVSQLARSSPSPALWPPRPTCSRSTCWVTVLTAPGPTSGGIQLLPRRHW